jgi:hypothetical protein
LQIVEGSQKQIIEDEQLDLGQAGEHFEMRAIGFSLLVVAKPMPSELPTSIALDCTKNSPSFLAPRLTRSTSRSAARIARRSEAEG